MSRFPTDQLAAIDAALEVEIETRPAADEPSHRTIIWIVAEADEVFVRSVRGGRGRWYREAMATREAILRVGGAATAVRITPAIDAPSIDRCSRALRRKYAGDPALGTMLRPETLSTTLRLDPR